MHLNLLNNWSIFFKGNERNAMSSPMTIKFSAPQKEFWLRFYYRIPSGQRVAGIYEHKIIYAFTDSAVAADVNWPGGNGSGREQSGTPIPATMTRY